MKSCFIPLIFFIGFFIMNQPATAQNKYLKLGDKAFDQYQYGIAIENYRKALIENNNDKAKQNLIVLRLADSYAKMGNWKQSATYYNKIANSGILEKNPPDLFSYAIVMQYVGDFDVAEIYYRKYLQKVPADSLAQRKLSGLLFSRESRIISNYKIINVKTINSRDDDFGIAFLNSMGEEVTFTSNRKGTSGREKDPWTNALFTDLYTSKKNKEGKFQRPVNTLFQGLINTTANEGTPFLNADFSTLYFTRCEKVPKSNEEDIWCFILKSDKTASGWANPEVVIENPTGSVGHPTLTTDERVMIYAGFDADGFGGKDLWIINRDTVKSAFQKAINIGSIINTSGDELFPYLFNDTTLYFASDGLIGFGGLDIFVTYCDKSGNWLAPENIGAPFNSNMDDFGVIFSDMNKEHGYLCSNRDGGTGGDDIYAFHKQDYQLSLKGKIRDAKTLLPIENLDFLFLQNIDSLQVKTDSNGFFIIGNEHLKRETNYTLVVEKENYFSQKIPFSTTGVEGDFCWTLNIDLNPISETPIILPEILYEFDKWDLLPQYQDSLQALVKILNDNPKFQIELRSHTDSRASDSYNQELSQKRAQTVVDFLIRQGIDAGRLVAKGYGSKSPRVMEQDYIYSNFTIPKGSVLNQDYLDMNKKPEHQEIVHQLNRRTEFFVVSKNYQK